MEKVFAIDRYGGGYSSDIAGYTTLSRAEGNYERLYTDILGHDWGKEVLHLRTEKVSQGVPEIYKVFVKILGWEGDSWYEDYFYLKELEIV